MESLFELTENKIIIPTPYLLAMKPFAKLWNRDGTNNKRNARGWSKTKVPSGLKISLIIKETLGAESRYAGESPGV